MVPVIQEGELIGYQLELQLRMTPTIDARTQIDTLRAKGHGWTTVARTLNARGVPTPSGRGQWHPDSARRHVEPGRTLWARYMREQYRPRHR